MSHREDEIEQEVESFRETVLEAVKRRLTLSPSQLVFDQPLRRVDPETDHFELCWARSGKGFDLELKGPGFRIRAREATRELSLSVAREHLRRVLDGFRRINQMSAPELLENLAKEERLFLPYMRWLLENPETEQQKETR